MITGSYTDVRTGAVYAIAYAKVFPLETQTEAPGYARFVVNVWANVAAYTAGKETINRHNYVLQGSEFTDGIVVAAQWTYELMLVAANTQDKCDALAGGLVYSCEIHALSQPQFSGWTQ